MTRSMEPNETADIRRALDRLQQNFELLNDRYRDVRRERKQLRERIDELARERETADVAGAAQSEMAAHDRRRAVELEERALRAERRADDVVGRIDELERAIAERESMIADQEDTLQKLRADLDAQRRTTEEVWTEGERLREEADTLRRELVQAETALDRFRDEMNTTAVVGEGEVVISGAELEKLRSESVTLRQNVTMQRQERVDMEGKHYQAIAKLDAATRAEALARAETAALREENTSLERSVAELKDAYANLETVANSGDDGRAAAEAQAELAENHERAMAAMHERLEQHGHDHAAALADMDARLTAADLERERLEHQVRELRGERDSARAIAERLREQLNHADASDDDRLKAQRMQIDALGADLTEALDMAALKETELAEASQELEALRSRVAAMVDELEHARTVPAANGTAISDEERRRLGTQIDQAITLIDRHLEKGA